jgi:ABC-type Fe3+-hydroxamate transport system substrate-binding protein
MLKLILFYAVSASSLVDLSAHANPRLRVASLSVAADEILWELSNSSSPSRSNHRCDFEISGLSSLANAAEYSNIASKVQSFRLLKADSESILKSKAELVIVTPFNSPELINQLRSLKIRVAMLEKFDSVEDIIHNIRQIGDWTRCAGAADQLAKTLNGNMAVQPVVGERPKILAWNGTLTLPGDKTLIADIIHRAGGENILASHGYQGWTNINAEKLSTLQPDLILVSGSQQDKPLLLKQLQQSACCKNMAALTSDRVLVIPERLMSAASHHIYELYRLIIQASASQGKITHSPPAEHR